MRRFAVLGSHGLGAARLRRSKPQRLPDRAIARRRSDVRGAARCGVPHAGALCCQHVGRRDLRAGLAACFGRARCAGRRLRPNSDEQAIQPRLFRAERHERQPPQHSHGSEAGPHPPPRLGLRVGSGLLDTIQLEPATNGSTARGVQASGAA
jgi:hypothetical protein